MGAAWLRAVIRPFRTVAVLALTVAVGCGLAGCHGGGAPADLVLRHDPMPLTPYNCELKLAPRFEAVRYVTIHNTAEPFTAAQERDRVATRCDGVPVSFHFAVDEQEAVRILPLEYGGWHAGNRVGNCESIGIEICRSQWRTGEWYDASEENAARLAAWLLKRYDLPLDALRMHQDWSGKYCPHRILERNGWEVFRARVAFWLARGVNVEERDAAARPADAAGVTAVLLQPGGANANGAPPVIYQLTAGGALVDTADLIGYLRRIGGAVLLSSWVRDDDGPARLAELRRAGIPVAGYFVLTPDKSDYERINLIDSNQPDSQGEASCAQGNDLQAD